MKYLGAYNLYTETGNTIDEVYEEICNEYGYLDIKDIKFYQLTPLEVERKLTYTIKPQF